MVKTIILTNFTVQSSALTNVIDRKIIKSKTSTVNADISNKLKIEIGEIKNLLDTLERRYKKCEIIYYTFFENLDHLLLSGNSVSLPFHMDCTFIDNVATIKSINTIDDKYLYQEIIDLNFQSFVLLISSMYENIVRLTEIIVKKVIVHLKKKEPLSTPLHDYISYLKLLIDLGYRSNDKLQVCISSYRTYFEKYLETINSLRNSFIHGYSTNLGSDGYNYRIVSKFDKDAFSPNSPDLNIDIFCKVILDNTKKFIADLLVTLKESIQHHRKVIPV